MAKYEVEILVHGNPIKMFRHKGKFFVEGRKGSSFELKFSNNTWENIEVVPSVDGLSVLDGEACGETSEGYLVPADGSVTIPGWRLNNNSVAEFVFKDKNRSYANQSGKDTTNVGVIGFMVFKEKEHAYVPPFQPWPEWPPYKTYPSTPWIGTAGMASNVKASSTSSTDTNIPLNLKVKGSGKVDIQNMSIGAKSRRVSHEIFMNDDVETTETFNIGTGWGDEVEHRVSVVDFERQNPTMADALISVFYDTKRGLEARGIKVVKGRRKKTQDLPDAFPTYTDTGCKPPSGWRRSRR